jgi:hypothetical protein
MCVCVRMFMRVRMRLCVFGVPLHVCKLMKFNLKGSFACHLLSFVGKCVSS